MKKIKFYSLVQAGAVDTIDVVIDSDATIQDVLDAMGITDPEATVYFGHAAYMMSVPERDLNAVVPEWHTMYWKAAPLPPVTDAETENRAILESWGYWDEPVCP